MSYTLDQVLGPVAVEDFYAAYWEKQPLHIARPGADHFSALLTCSHIETALSTQELLFPDVQLTQTGKSIPPQDYTDDRNRIIPLRFVQHYSTGATMVISQAHRLFGSLSSLCRNIQSELQLRCQGNVYLSPPGSQGFKPHYDTHEVFVLQVNGKKTFRFYSSGVELPFSHDKHDSEKHPEASKTEEVTLTPGDTLYIPRGVTHDALANKDEPSLHITLGVFPITIGDVLQEMTQIAAEKDAQYRCSVPGSEWLRSNGVSAAMCERFQSLYGKAFTSENLHEAVSRLRDDVALGSKQDCTGLLSNIHRLNTVNPGSFIRLRNGVAMNLELQGSILRLRTSGQILEFSEPMSSAVQWLVHARKTRISALPGLDDEQKIALAHRLLQENIVEVPVSG
jgi:ribosomal protein L16 Arg81 hydroxylase